MSKCFQEEELFSLLPQPRRPLRPWNAGGTVAGVRSEDGLGKASTSLLFGQFAFLRQCPSAGKPDPKLLWRRLHSSVERHNALFAEGPRLRVVVPLGHIQVRDSLLFETTV